MSRLLVHGTYLSVGTIGITPDGDGVKILGLIQLIFRNKTLKSAFDDFVSKARWLHGKVEGNLKNCGYGRSLL